MKFAIVLNFLLLPASILAFSVSVTYVHDDDLTNNEDTMALTDQVSCVINICHRPTPNFAR